MCNEKYDSLNDLIQNRKNYFQKFNELNSREKLLALVILPGSSIIFPTYYVFRGVYAIRNRLRNQKDEGNLEKKIGE
jgi:hypothetical protein